MRSPAMPCTLLVSAELTHDETPLANAAKMPAMTAATSSPDLNASQKLMVYPNQKGVFPTLFAIFLATVLFVGGANI